jgi:hypothetical protein
MHQIRLLFYTTNSAAATGTSIGSISTSWLPKTAQQVYNFFSIPKSTFIMQKTCKNKIGICNFPCNLYIWPIIQL